MKKTNFKHHPVQMGKGTLAHGEEWAGLVMLELVSEVLASDSLSQGEKDNRGTILLNDACAALTPAIDVPDGAGAVILSVASQDSGGSGAVTYFALGYGGIVDPTGHPGRTTILYNAKENDEWRERLMIIPLAEGNVIDIFSTPTGANTLDYVLKLVGWVILGTEYTKPDYPYEDLKAVFTI